MLAVIPACAQTWVSDLVVVPVQNDTTVGTANYHLAKLNQEGQAVVLATGDTSGFIGIVQQDAGKSGKAQIAQMGVGQCEFDGATTSGDYVQASTTTGGLCHDAGATFPGSGSIVGRVMSTNAGAGVFEILVFPAESRAASSTGSATTGSGSNGAPKASSNAAVGSAVIVPAAGDPGGAPNAVQYNNGSAFGGVVNTSPSKQFLSQTAGGPPAFSGIGMSDLPAISSNDLSDSSSLIRDNQVTLAGTAPSSFPGVAPGANLDAYGDSITAGKGASTWAHAYVSIVSNTKGWILHDHAIGGDGIFDQLAEGLWGSTVTPSNLSLMMIGANDNGYVYKQSEVWDPALQAAYLWLLTPSKQFGSGLSQTGTWAQDPTYSFGIYTTEDKASASGHTFGNVVYVVARSTTTNSPTFTINVDGTVYGPYTTPVPWTTPRGHNFAPYSVRIANLATTYHTVTVSNQGSGELHVDFITGNKGQLTPTGPYLYAATVYKLSSAFEFMTEFLNNQIRTTATQLAADGLGLVLADVEGDCANPQMVDGKTPGGSNCSQYDGNHPDDAGHRIIANAFLRMMPGSGSSGSNGNYPTNPNFVSISSTTANLNTVNTTSVSSTGWLALKSASGCYWMISGPGHLINSENGLCSIGTDNSGALLGSPFGAPRDIRATNLMAGGYSNTAVQGTQKLVLTTNTSVWILYADANPAIAVPAGNGARFTVMICQDKVGGHTLSWPSNVKNAAVPDKTANQCTVQEFVQTGLGSGDLVGLGAGGSFQP